MKLLGRLPEGRPARMGNLRVQRKASRWADPHYQMELAWAFPVLPVGLTGKIICPEITESNTFSPRCQLDGMIAEAVFALGRSTSGHYTDDCFEQ